MTASLLPVPIARFVDSNGLPLAGGLVYTYVTGTTTPLASYADATQTVLNTNPIVLDAQGQANIWIAGNYTINVTDANNVQQNGYPVDNVQDLFTADNVTATSTTSVTISSTSQTFTIQPDRYFPPGIFLLVVETSNTANYMHGQVTSYIGTQLVINVTTIHGSGTHADWTISLSGPVGPVGPTGGTGAGSGNVNGPATTVVGYLPTWGNTTGTLLAAGTGGPGTAAYLNVGTAANQIVQLDGNAKLPAVDASQLLDVPSTGNVILAETLYSVASRTVTITIASPAVIRVGSATVSEHFVPRNGSPVRFTTSGSLPTGITAGVTYYVRDVAGISYSISATPFGTAINTSGSQSGTHTQASPPYTKATNNPRIVRIRLVGGGGGIGGGTVSGSGGYNEYTLLASSLSSSEAVSPGAGGSGTGNPGSNSSFGTTSITLGDRTILPIQGAGGAASTGVGSPSGTGSYVYDAAGISSSGYTAFGVYQPGSGSGTTSSINSGNGFSGCVVITEYS